MYTNKYISHFGILILLVSLLQLGFTQNNLSVNAAQSTNLDTNMTTYIGSNGDDQMSATAIGNDNTVWFAGSNLDTIRITTKLQSMFSAAVQEYFCITIVTVRLWTLC